MRKRKWYLHETGTHPLLSTVNGPWLVTQCQCCVRHCQCSKEDSECMGGVCSLCRWANTTLYVRGLNIHRLRYLWLTLALTRLQGENQIWITEINRTSNIKYHKNIIKAKHIQCWFMKGDIKNRETEEEAQWVYGCLFYKHKDPSSNPWHPR